MNNWRAIQDIIEDEQIRDQFRVMVKAYIKARGWTKKHAATEFNVACPVLLDFLQGKPKIARFQSYEKMYEYIKNNKDDLIFPTILR
jgi:hypothetical protein